MSYARIGDDSDVYVWSDNTFVWIHVSPVLTIVNDTLPVGVKETISHHRAGQTLMFTDRQEAYATLGAMCAEGVNVPGYVFTRLYDEMENLGNKVGIKRMAKYTTVVSP